MESIRSLLLPFATAFSVETTLTFIHAQNSPEPLRFLSKKRNSKDSPPSVLPKKQNRDSIDNPLPIRQKPAMIRQGFRQRRSIFKFTIAGLCAAVMATAMSPLSAAVVTFTDISLWEAEVAPGTVFDFEGFAPPNSYTSGTPIPGLSITVNGDYHYIVGRDYAGGVDSLNGTDSLQAGYTDRAALIVFTSDVTAFGTLIGFTTDNPNPPTGVFTASLYQGSTMVGTTYTSAPIQSGFLGFTSDIPFDRVIFSHSLPSTYLTYDNMTFTNVPEPTAAGLLMATGAAILGTRRRRSMGLVCRMCVSSSQRES